MSSTCPMTTSLLTFKNVFYHKFRLEELNSSFWPWHCKGNTNCMRVQKSHLTCVNGQLLARNNECGASEYRF